MFVARIAVTVGAIASLAAGCASNTVRAPRTNAALRDGSSASGVVTEQELSRTGRGGSLMDALARIRPSMLHSRGTGVPSVSVDGGPPGELALLRTISASLVREVRLQRLSSSVGQPVVSPNGDITLGDILVVTTWRGGRRER